MFILFLFSLLPRVSSDLPVHCLRHQLLGDWSLVLSEVFEVRSSCGHGTHDKVEMQPSAREYFEKHEVDESILLPFHAFPV